MKHPDNILILDESDTVPAPGSYTIHRAAARPPRREILLLRHGSTEGNALRRYIGRTDEPLSAEGRAALAERRLAFPAPPAVYVTPLRRTRETAELLFPDARQITVPGLREMDFGDFENRSFADMAGDAAYRAWVDSGCLAPIPNGESREGFTARCCAAFRAVLSQDKSARLVFVVHGGTIMALCSALVRPPRDYYDWQAKNGAGFLLRTLGAGPEMELAGEI